jgi:carboxylesterase
MTSIPEPLEGLRYEGGPHGVLMLHGLSANSMELARLAKDLHVQGFTVHAPDIAGYCYGSPPQAWTAWVTHAQEHLWAMQKTCETVSVVGLSMGATLALVLAQRESVTAMCLLSTALAYDGWAMPWYQFLSKWASWLPFAKYYRFVEEEPFGVKNEEMRAMIKRSMKQNHISESGADVLSVHHIAEGQKLIRAAREGLAQVSSPVLFIHAVDDETVHVRNAEWAYRQVASRDKQIIYLGDSYHMITVDNERETVSQEVARALKQAVNRSLGQPAFELPPIQSAELRRALRQKN